MQKKFKKKNQNQIQQLLDQKIKNQFEIIKKIGTGAYGHVFKVKHKSTNEVFALKKIFSAFQNQTDAQRTYRQIVYLSKLKHHNIIKLKKVIRAENNNDLYLLFQHMQSDLFFAIKENLLNSVHKKFIVYQLALCLKYIHSCGLLHRDLKPSNILINNDCKIKLCDFGLSRSLYKYNNNQQKLTQFIATRWYRSPQVLFGSQYYTTKSDMWSLGCLIYELFTRKSLLPGKDTIDQMQKLLQFKGHPSQEQIKSLKISKLAQVIDQLKIQKRSLQYYFKYIEDQQIKKILLNLFQYIPQKRWSAEDLLNSQYLSGFRDNDIYEQIVADQFIKTPINDSQKKAAVVYRQAIYDFYVIKNQGNFAQDTIIQQKQINKQNKFIFNGKRYLSKANNNTISQSKLNRNSWTSSNNQQSKKLIKTQRFEILNNTNNKFYLNNTQRNQSIIGLSQPIQYKYKKQSYFGQGIKNQISSKLSNSNYNNKITHDRLHNKQFSFSHVPSMIKDKVRQRFNKQKIKIKNNNFKEKNNNIQSLQVKSLNKIFSINNKPFINHKRTNSLQNKLNGTKMLEVSLLIKGNYSTPQQNIKVTTRVNNENFCSIYNQKKHLKEGHIFINGYLKNNKKKLKRKMKIQ